MPASELSLVLTSAYRERVNAIRGTSQAVARANWSRITIEDLDDSYFAWQVAVGALVRAAQSQAVSASNGYLAAFLESELGKPTEAARAPLGDFMGRSRDGRELNAPLSSPLIGIKTALKDGKGVDGALREGQDRAIRTIGLEIDFAARRSLQDALIADPHIEGYRRAVRGTCGACLGAASGTYGTGVSFPVHPGCQCVTEPVVRGARDRFPRPTGAALFAAMTLAEQDEALGPEAAELVRSGSISLTDLVGTSPQETTDDFLTQRPASALV